MRRRGEALLRQGPYAVGSPPRTPPCTPPRTPGTPTKPATPGIRAGPVDVLESLGSALREVHSSE
jgi:hypothetical protein